MIADEWDELREAIQNSAWVPLEEGGEELKSLQWSTLRDRSNRGDIERGDDMRTARYYTLTYSYMHFNALCATIMCDEMKPHWEEKIVRTDGNRVVHVDFGCGPGTSSWAIARLLGKRKFTTIGYDHNENMIQLADEITSAIAYGCDVNFFVNWDDFNSKIDTIIGGSTILVTINHLLNQRGSSEISRMMHEVIRKLDEYSAQTLMVSVEPKSGIYNGPYTKTGEGNWNQFKDILPHLVCDREINYETISAYEKISMNRTSRLSRKVWVRARASSA